MDKSRQISEKQKEGDSTDMVDRQVSHNIRTQGNERQEEELRRVERAERKVLDADAKNTTWRLTARQKRYIISQFHNKTLTEIAAEVGCSVTNVCTYTKRFGLRKYKFRWNKTSTDELIRLYNMGYPYKKIAEIMGSTHNNLSSRISRLRAAGLITSRRLDNRPKHQQ